MLAKDNCPRVNEATNVYSSSDVFALADKVGRFILCKNNGHHLNCTDCPLIPRSNQSAQDHPLPDPSSHHSSS